jgi:hypothetical protein
MDAGAARKKRSEPAEGVAPRPLDMNDLGPELRELRPNKRLRHYDARTHHANAFKRTECGDYRRRGRALQALDPLGHSLLEFLDLIFILHESRIVRHAQALPRSPISDEVRGD